MKLGDVLGDSERELYRAAQRQERELSRARKKQRESEINRARQRGEMIIYKPGDR